jgi:hypothetical protein
MELKLVAHANKTAGDMPRGKDKMKDGKLAASTIPTLPTFQSSILPLVHSSFAVRAALV